MTVIYFDAETREAFRKIAELVDIMGIEFEQELSDTEIVDKDGVVHDLAELAKLPCVISTGVSYIMSIDDYYAVSGPRWVTYSGHFYNRPEELAKAVRDHADDPDVEITVHKF